MSVSERELVVRGSSEVLSAHWSDNDQSELRRRLEQIARDDRIMAAAACTANLTLLASTPGFPSEFSCEDIGAHVRHSDGEMADTWSQWDESTSLPGGSVFVSAIPLENEGRHLGFIILIHDLSDAEQRENRTTRFVLLAYGFLALAASVATIIVARFTWRGWRDEIRRIARGGAPQRPEFQPILRRRP